MKQIHVMPHPAREPGDDPSTSLRFIPGKLRGETKLVNRYQALQTTLLETDDYIPVSLAEYTPDHRRFRYIYVKEIQLPFSVQVYTSYLGGNKPSVAFIWKCGVAPDLTRSNTVVTDIQKDLPTFHTRQMRKDFHNIFSLVYNTSKTVLN